jgi:quinolinate synthase
MAGMISVAELRFARTRHPDAAVVCYVNTTADIKAESDICCTSANAVSVINAVRENTVIFVPDRNLGHYAARFTKKNIFPWEGFCLVHDRFSVSDVAIAKQAHPDAAVLVHPECRPDVIDLADQVASTSGIVRYVKSAPENEFIIGTEIGIMHRLTKECPGKRYFPLSEKAVCVNMKKTTLMHVRNALVTSQPVIAVPEEIATRARRSIERMLML